MYLVLAAWFSFWGLIILRDDAGRPARPYRLSEAQTVALIQWTAAIVCAVLYFKG